MRIATWYRIGLFSPLFLSLILTGLILSLPTVPTLLGGLAAVLMVSLLYGGPPYFLFSILVLAIFRNTTQSQVARLPMILPIFLAPFCCAGTIFLFHPIGVPVTLEEIAIHFLMMPLTVGYFYAFVFIILTRSVISLGLIQE